MADLAISRIQLVDNSKIRADGKRIHQVIPWQIVTYPGAPPLLEPVDAVIGNESSFTTTKQITGILFCDMHVFVAENGTGGDVGAFRAVRPWD